jgi:hypothetical protein
MKRNGLLLILLAMASLAGASWLVAEEEEVQPNILRSKDGRIQIELPRSYAEKPPSNATIQIQAVDDAKLSTVLVISEDQAQFESFEQYSEVVRGKMSENLRDSQVDIGVKCEIAGHHAVRYEITGISSNGLRLGFLVTLIQTDTRYNRVIESCLRTRFADRREEFVKIAANLKELPAGKVGEGK